MITFVHKAAKSLLLGAVAAGAMQAATVTYTLNNFTLSSGDPVFSVATDVTFNNLILSEVFAGGTVNVPLFNASNVAQTSLSTTTLDLHSAALSDSDTALGALTQARVTGTLSQTSLSIVTSFGGSPAAASVNQGFSAFLLIAGPSVNVNATDASGKTYAIGTLDEVRSAAGAVPEPGTLAIASLGLLGLAVAARRLKEVA